MIAILFLFFALFVSSVGKDSALYPMKLQLDEFVGTISALFKGKAAKKGWGRN